MVVEINRVLLIIISQVNVQNLKEINQWQYLILFLKQRN